MKDYQKLRRFIAFVPFLFFACKKNDTPPPVVSPDPGTINTDSGSIAGLFVPAAFNYETSQKISLNVTILAPDKTPVKNVPVNILNKSEELGGVVLYRSVTNDKGKISATVVFPANLDQLVIDAKYLGVIRNAVVPVSANLVECTLGGPNGYSSNLILNSPLSGKPSPGTNTYSHKPLGLYTYMGSFDNLGKPNYLESSNDVISSSFLANINASLPERQPVMTYHPDYLGNNVETNLNITALSDIWFTFVTEGAGYRNSIAYFTYPTNNPPQTTGEIDSLHIILPNASLAGSGGSLVAGNKINLGRFTAGTSIGFALIADGWNGTNVGSGNWIVYSLDQLNPVSAPNLKRQSVLLYDNTQGLFLVGFEDIRRDNAGCDNDFNDCIFYVKGNPVTAISQARVNPIDKPVDTDHDGVNDVYDDFPNDPTRAYINYYPSKTTMGTLAFEDNWPYLGDYDMNDLVVGYRYTVISNALNNPIEMKAQYLLEASGATFKNGFGVEFPFLCTLVKSCTGSIVTDNRVVTIGTNGCEAGQNKAVIIPFDDAFAAMNSGSGFINTISGGTFLSRDTITMNMVFTRPVTQAEFGTAPFNPFIIIDRTRGREAHMPGYPPTQKAELKYFKTGSDYTIPSQNRYYKTRNNLPWGISFAENFSYPAESKAINKGYKNFVQWANSGGTVSNNWYKDSANMVNDFIYHR